jgi:hypothetical protein
MKYTANVSKYFPAACATPTRSAGELCCGLEEHDACVNEPYASDPNGSKSGVEMQA